MKGFEKGLSYGQTFGMVGRQRQLRLKHLCANNVAFKAEIGSVGLWNPGVLNEHDPVISQVVSLESALALLGKHR